MDTFSIIHILEIIGITFLVGIQLFVWRYIKKDKTANIINSDNLSKISKLNDVLTLKEQELIQANAKFGTLFKYAPVAINSFTSNGKLDLWNNECTKLLGYTKEEILQSPDAMKLFYGNKSKQVWQDIYKADGIFKEYHPKTKSGKVIKMAWANMSLPDGRILSIGCSLKGQHKHILLAAQGATYNDT